MGRANFFVGNEGTRLMKDTKKFDLWTEIKEKLFHAEYVENLI